MSAVFTIGKSIEIGLPVHIGNAKNGLGCNCACYQCNEKLEAVQGKRDWYFRHSNKSNCVGSPETALHEFGKFILMRSSFIETKKKKIEYIDPCLETSIGKYRSDVSAKYRNEDLHFEVVVNHDLEPDKKEYFQSQKINCIRIDLSDPKLLSAHPEIIKHAVIEDQENKDFIQWNEENASIESPTNSKNDNWLTAIGISIVSFFILLYFWIRRNKKRRRF